MTKKRFIDNSIAVFGVVLSLTGVCSCKNFLKADETKKEIEQNIAYANAPSYSIFVSAEEGTGTITMGGGLQSAKVTDSFSVEFQASSDYEFICWIAVDRNNQNVSKEKYIAFSDKESPSTKVTLLYASEDILIKPYCLSYLRVTNSLPEYKENGVGYNSPIKITFSDYIDETAFSYTEEEIKNLDLMQNELLKATTFDGSEYVYGYQRNGRIVYKNIEITATGGLGNITHYFKEPVIINGNTLYLELKNAYYEFLTSDLTDDTTKEITVNLSNTIIDTRGMSFAKDYANLSFKYAINNQIIAETPSTQILFETQQGAGTISPAGSNTVYTELTYPLSFTPDDSFYFEHWGVFYAMDEQELPYANDILKIENKNSKNTSFVLTMAVPGIMVKPVCKERPVILLQSPVSDKTPAHSDISVIFSHEMDPADLRWEFSDISNDPIRAELRDSNQKIYGYISHADEHIWKNIKIESSTGQNLLSYFTYANYELNGTKLTIKADTSKTIPSGTVVFVRINKAIRDKQGIPCGDDGDIIEFSYLVE